MEAEIADHDVKENLGHNGNRHHVGGLRRNHHPRGDDEKGDPEAEGR